MASEFLKEDPIEQYPLNLQNMTALINISGAQIELYKNVYEAIEKSENNGFFATADEKTVKRYEDMIGIVAAPSDKLEFRRVRLQNRFNLNRKFTMRLYCEKLNDLIGVGKWSATINAARTKLTIESDATEAAWYKELEETIELMKPVRLNAEIKPVVSTKIHISAATTSQYMQYTFKVGVSKVGADTIGIAYSQEVEVGGKIMVTENQLNKIAVYVKNQIAKVLINDIVEITDFTLAIGKTANMLNPDEVIKGMYVNVNSGNMVENVAFNTYRDIPVLPETKYVLQRLNLAYFQIAYVFYDETYTYISGDSYKTNPADHYVIETPANAAYLTLSYSPGSDGRYPWDEMMLSQGEEKNVYTPYKEDSTITLEYVVSNDVVESITNIKIIDKTENIMMEQDVNVTTSDNVLMKHNITIQEGN